MVQKWFDSTNKVRYRWDAFEKQFWSNFSYFDNFKVLREKKLNKSVINTSINKNSTKKQSRTGKCLQKRTYLICYNWTNFLSQIILSLTKISEKELILIYLLFSLARKPKKNTFCKNQYILRFTGNLNSISTVLGGKCFYYVPENISKYQIPKLIFSLTTAINWLMWLFLFFNH